MWCNGMEKDGMERNEIGMAWKRMECGGMEWHGVAWDGMQRNTA